MSWAGTFALTFVLATLFTVLYTVERGIIFSAAMATASWSLLALTPEIVVTSGGEEILMTIGGVRWLFAGLALLSSLVLVLALFGEYPDDAETETPEPRSFT